MQREMLEEHCKRLGWPKPFLYIDKATTSRIPLNERDEGKQLCAVLDRGDKVVITKLDRAFRSHSRIPPNDGPLATGSALRSIS